MTSDHDALLDALDDALVSVRRVPRRPVYRRRFLGEIEPAGAQGTVRVLRVVERNPDRPPSIAAVAEALVVDPSTASRMVDRCVSNGFLERVPGAEDRRQVQLRLTPAGWELLHRANANRRALLAEVTDGWPAEDLHHLVSRLQALLDGFDRIEAEGQS